MGDKLRGGTTIGGYLALHMGNINLSNAGTAFQEKLVSGSNIKTVNNESILGSGDITVGGGVPEWNKVGCITIAGIKTNTGATVPIGTIIPGSGLLKYYLYDSGYLRYSSALGGLLKSNTVSAAYTPAASIGATGSWRVLTEVKNYDLAYDNSNLWSVIIALVVKIA